jgi:hypothetical protein
MNPLKIGFYAAVLMSTAGLVVLINNLPTVFDIVTTTAGTIGGVLVGRRSNEWF